MNDMDAKRLVTYLTGTCGEIGAALETLGIDADVEDAEDVLEAANLERCSGCDWWFDSGELIDDDDNVVGCDQCRPQEQDV